MLEIIFIQFIIILLKVYKNYKINNKIKIKKLLKEIEKIIYAILVKGSIVFYNNKRGIDPYFIYDKIIYGEKNIEINYKQLMKYKIYYQNNKKKNVDKNIINFFDFLKEFEMGINDKFKYNYFFMIKMKFNKEKEGINNNIENDNLYNITSEITFLTVFNKKTYTINNILYDGTNSTSNGFIYLINDLNNEGYANIEYEDNIIDLKDKINNNKNRDIEDKSTQFTSFFIYEETNDEYLILKFKNKIENYSESEYYEDEFTKIINNGKNNDEIIKNYIKLKIIIGADDGKPLSSHKDKIPSISEIDIPGNKLRNIILMNKKKFIICYEKETLIFDNLFWGPSFTKKNILSKTSYIGGIKINENIVALTSNKLLPNGKDQLLLYDINNKKDLYNKEGYSFSISPNNSTLINIPKLLEKNINIILFACQKYFKNQKNGILLLTIDSNFGIYNRFFETKNFEVHCFCQIAKLLNDEMKVNLQFIDIEYFLVSGLDYIKNKELIKLYKINFKSKVDTIEVECIEEIIFEKNNNFKGFSSVIISINQSKTNGDILVTCKNGDCFIFNKPKIDCFNKILNINDLKKYG